MSIQIENVPGCEVVEHSEAYTKYLSWLSRTAAMCIVTTLIVAVVVFFGWLILMSGWSFNKATTLMLVALAGVYAINGFLEQHTRKISYHEKYILRIADTVSAMELLRIQSEYELTPGEGENIWVATKRNNKENKGERKH